MGQLYWQIQSFNELSTTTLYGILALRNQVFIVEQNCPYQDMDGIDLHCLHLFAYDQARLAAYARILPPDNENTPAIGRVIVEENYRTQGVGHLLIKKAKACIKQHFGQCSIKLASQSHLVNFYAQHGFVVVGEEYLEDGIPHKSMRLDN